MADGRESGTSPRDKVVAIFLEEIQGILSNPKKFLRENWLLLLLATIIGLGIGFRIGIS